MRPIRLLAVVGCLAVSGHALAQEQSPPAAATPGAQDTQARATTIENLRKASQGEADAVHRYELFAQRAEQEGYAQVAKLFRAAALSETVHLRNHQRVLQSLGETPRMPTPAKVEVRSTRENLLVPIQGERGEATEMYPRYAQQAESAGIPAAVRTFQYAGEAERGHEALFRRALDELGKNPAADYFVQSENGRVNEQRPGRVASVTQPSRG